MVSSRNTTTDFSFVFDLCIYCWLVRTSHRPISRTVWLKVPPCKSDHTSTPQKERHWWVCLDLCANFHVDYEHNLSSCTTQWMQSRTTSHLENKNKRSISVGIRWLGGSQKPANHQEHCSDIFGGCVQRLVISVWFLLRVWSHVGLFLSRVHVACRPVTPRLWCKFLVWPMQMVSVERFYRLTWRFLPSLQPSWSQLIFPFLFAVEEFTVLNTKVAPFPWLLWGVAFTACVVFLLLFLFLWRFLRCAVSEALAAYVVLVPCRRACWVGEVFTQY